MLSFPTITATNAFFVRMKHNLRFEPFEHKLFFLAHHSDNSILWIDCFSLHLTPSRSVKGSCCLIIFDSYVREAIFSTKIKISVFIYVYSGLEDVGYCACISELSSSMICCIGLSSRPNVNEFEPWLSLLDTLNMFLKPIFAYDFRGLPMDSDENFMDCKEIEPLEVLISPMISQVLQRTLIKLNLH